MTHNGEALTEADRQGRDGANAVGHFRSRAKSNPLRSAFEIRLSWPVATAPGQRNDTAAPLSSACVEPLREHAGHVQSSRRDRLNDCLLKFGVRRFRNAQRQLTRIRRGTT
jgi:hypothetical protein